MPATAGSSSTCSTSFRLHGRPRRYSSPRSFSRIDTSGFGLFNSTWVTQSRCHLVSFNITTKTPQLRDELAHSLEKLTPAHTAGIAKLIIGNHQVALDGLEKTGSADLSFSVPGDARFRVNIFKQRGTHAIIMRVIPMRPPQFSDFNLPEQLKEIADIKNGIVLVTGPTGSGKSSTLAAIIDLINETHYYHIVTIEDPIEFLHTHKNSTIHQRELHSDTPSFSIALRAALRQAPKVILVGEMRDRETIEVALEARAALWSMSHCLTTSHCGSSLSFFSRR